jgi:Tfp pilus assembly protein PilW
MPIIREFVHRSPLRNLRSECGATLIELLIVSAMLIIVVGATLDLFQVASNAQSRDQNYAEEVTSTQTALARLVHDLRQATSFQLVSPQAIQFQLLVAGTSYNVKYDCTASDSLGSAYRRCARTQAVAPTAPPAAGSTASSLDVQHITNGAVSTFCNGAGTGMSGAVFFVSNPTIANTDGSTLACDEAYETLIGPELKTPTYVQVLVKVPASGTLVHGGMTHTTVLKVGAFLPNSDAGA